MDEETSQEQTDQAPSDEELTGELDLDIYDVPEKKQKKRSRFRLDEEPVPVDGEKPLENSDVSVKEEPAVKFTKDQLGLREKMLEIRDKLNTLRWDVEHGQINPAKKVHFDKLKKEFDDLQMQFEATKKEQK